MSVFYFEGPMLLRWYCLYVLVIAVNGTTECFVFATMSKSQVDRYNQKMVAFSVLFLISSLVLTSYLGSVGFILANCLNMIARILHSIYYIGEYYKNSEYKPLSNVCPSPYVIASLLLSLCLTCMSESYFCCDKGAVYRLLHICIGGLALCSTLAVIYWKETHVVTFVNDQYRNRHKH
ncbi:protein RFT1 homolog [Ruditapes philippinarum]|uniref:protein RFT1 homolog n=1 Tax=Ruditapes philippinarum TaxID=129788 RepID=UPI00295C2536|nr:protein RFT1 homolog [Ruditapes philippinarum]